MTSSVVKPTFQQQLESDAFCYGAEVVTSRGFSPPGESDRAVNLAGDLTADPRIAWISITDNPGGAPMLPPDYLAGLMHDSGCPLVVHLTCKDANRSTLEASAWRYAGEGCNNILALTGDYPTSAYGGMPKPVFDIDSVGLISMLSDMNRGLQVAGRGGKIVTLPQTDFYTGCAVSPFKRHERELVPQYFKLLAKIKTGAQWVLPQLGYDMSKFNEIKLLLSACDLDIPVIGNVYLLTRGVARMFNQGKLPGCFVSDDLMALADKYGKGEDKGREFFRDLAAKQLAIFKGLGFAAGYLGGIGRADTFFDIIDRAEKFGENDWRQFMPELCFSLPDEFFLFDRDDKSYFSASDQMNPESLHAMLKRRTNSEVSLSYRISRLVHSLAFTRDKRLYGICKRMHQAIYRKDEPGMVARMAHGLERSTKLAMYGCKDCGDCSLPNLAYLCPNSSCSKGQRNGPCGGSMDGRCEKGDKDCFWARVYQRLAGYGEIESLPDRPVVISNPALEETSAWANFYLNRDHNAEKDSEDDPTAGSEHAYWERAKRKQPEQSE